MARERGLLGTLIATAALAAALIAQPALAQQKTLKFVPEADLRILDPIWTTAYITRNHGYMVYDTLFAVNEKFEVQPQMVDKWTLSDDKLTYTFTLRDGLKFHDGQPVRSADCIASDRALGASAMRSGQKLAEVTESWKAVDDKTFTLKLKKPFPLTLEALAKPSSNVPFIMPERVAKTDAFTQHHRIDRLRSVQVREGGMGAGQQGRLRQEHRLRAAQGGAVVGVRRQGRQGRPRRVDLHPGFGDRRRGAQRRRSRLVAEDAARPGPAAGQEQGHQGREHRSAGLDGHDPLQPAASAVQQSRRCARRCSTSSTSSDYALAIAGERKNGKPCPSFFTCGSPPKAKSARRSLTGKRDMAKAKQLIQEAGYKGEKIVVLVGDRSADRAQPGPGDDRAPASSAGLNAELAANDWGTLINRRAVKEPIEKGGWNIFHTWLVGPDMANPAINYPLRGVGEKSWFGWPTDPKMEELRDAWFDAPDAAVQKKLD